MGPEVHEKRKNLCTLTPRHGVLKSVIKVNFPRSHISIDHYQKLKKPAQKGVPQQHPLHLPHAKFPEDTLKQ